MSDQITLTVSPEPLQKLVAVMGEYVEALGKSASQALQKAAREVDYAMLVGFRKQPPRPVAGTITAAAIARGYRVATNSDSYVTGYQQALGILGGAKSGFFRITEKDGRVNATLVLAGKAPRVIERGPGGRIAGTRLVSGKPAGTSELNLGALATLLALNQREKAAAGGYLASEFLTYKALNLGRFSGGSQIDKNRKTVGRVDAAETRVVIQGLIGGVANIAAKYGVVDKAVSAGADSFRADMIKKINDDAQKLIGKIGLS